MPLINSSLSITLNNSRSVIIGQQYLTPDDIRYCYNDSGVWYFADSPYNGNGVMTFVGSGSELEDRKWVLKTVSNHSNELEDVQNSVNVLSQAEGDMQDSLTTLAQNKVDKTITVNGHPLSSNVVISVQPLDSDLTNIAALDSSQSGVVASDGFGWFRKTYAQLKTALNFSKTDLGLSLVDNTADTSKPISSLQQTALDLKANISYVDSQVATKITPSAVDAKIAAIVGAAPAALDTLQEIATKLNDDESVVGALTSTVAGKEPSILAGTTLQYWRGDKSWRDFTSDVRGVILTGLSLITGGVISSTDSVVQAFGKLQYQITHLATVATSGLYSDLTGKPTIPAAQIPGDWTQITTSALDYIKNKPTIPLPTLGGTFVVTLPLIALGGVTNFTVTVPGATIGMVSDVDPQPNGSFLANLSNCRSVVTAANTVTIYLGAAILIVAGNQTFSVRVVQ